MRDETYGGGSQSYQEWYCRKDVAGGKLHVIGAERERDDRNPEIDIGIYFVDRQGKVHSDIFTVFLKQRTKYKQIVEGITERMVTVGKRLGSEEIISVLTALKYTATDLRKYGTRMLAR